MPLYTYECKTCKSQTDAFRSIEDRKEGPECCGEPMGKKIVPTMIQPIIGGGNFPGYKCPVTGEFVTSRKRRKQIMSENGLIEKD